MRIITLILLSLSLMLKGASLEKLPEIPLFPDSSIENEISDHRTNFSRTFEWFSYDLSKQVRAKLTGEFWTLFYRTITDIELIKEELTEKIEKANGEIVLDIKNNFSFFYPDAANSQQKYFVVMDFMDKNFKVQVMKFKSSQIKNALNKNKKKTKKDKFFTDTDKPFKLFYFGEKETICPNKYNEDMNEVVQILEKDNSKKVYIFGYADYLEGTSSEVNNIGDLRVLAIKKILLTKHIKDFQIVYINRAADPIYDKNTNGVENWRNRRVELFVK